MAIDKAKDGEKEEWHPEPPESFDIEFLTANSTAISHAMSDMGFGFERGGPVQEGVVHHIGKRRNGDGTTIEIIITMGKDYKSPKEIAALEAEKAKSK